MKLNKVDDYSYKIRNFCYFFKKGYNLIVTAWELPNYPSVWTKKLRNFNEVWAISHFVESSIRKKRIKTKYVGKSVELPSVPLLPRRYFGVRESAFTFLSSFDLTSFVDRKNLWAFATLSWWLREKRPYDDIQLLLHVK